MKKKPFFSIILPTCNREALLPRAIRSVMNQTFQDWELIVVDDGSTDETGTLVDSFSDERIRYFFQENKGQGAATNAGIQLAEGQYICFLDSDDEYFPNHLESLNVAIQARNAPIAIFRTLAVIHEPGKEKSRTTPGFRMRPATRMGQALFFATQYTGILTLCVHHSITKKLKFCEACTYWLDGHFEVRAATQFPLFQLEAATCRVNLHGNNMTNPSVTIDGLEARIAQHFNCLQSLFKGYRDEINLQKKELIRLEKLLACRFFLFYCLLAQRNHYFRKAFQLFRKAHQRGLWLHCLPMKCKVLIGFFFYALKKPA